MSCWMEVQLIMNAIMASFDDSSAAAHIKLLFLKALLRLAVELLCLPVGLFQRRSELRGCSPLNEQSEREKLGTSAEVAVFLEPTSGEGGFGRRKGRPALLLTCICFQFTSSMPNFA